MIVAPAGGPGPTHPAPTRPTTPPPPPAPPRPTPTKGHLPIGAGASYPSPPTGGARAGGPPSPGAGAKPVMPRPKPYLGFDIPGTAEIAAGVVSGTERHPLGRNCQIGLLLLPFTVAQVAFAGWRKSKRPPNRPPSVPSRPPARPKPVR